MLHWIVLNWSIFNHGHCLHWVLAFACICELFFYYNSSCIKQPPFLSHTIITSSIYSTTHALLQFHMHSQQAAPSAPLRGSAPYILLPLCKLSRWVSKTPEVPEALCIFNTCFLVTACPPSSQASCFACDLLTDSPGISAACSHLQCAPSQAA